MELTKEDILSLIKCIECYEKEPNLQTQIHRFILSMAFKITNSDDNEINDAEKGLEMERVKENALREPKAIQLKMKLYSLLNQNETVSYN